MRTVNVVVLIVSYKSAPLTIENLRSVQAQAASATPDIAIRAIVVDNASGDYPILQQAIEENGWGSWVTLILAPRNGGFAYGNNLAACRAFEEDAPDYLHLLNPDAQVEPGAITALVRFLESHGAVGIAGSSFENLDGSDWPIAFRFPSLISELCAALHIGLVSRLFQRWQVPRTMSRAAQPVDWISRRLDADPGAGLRDPRRFRRELFPLFRGDRLLPPSPRGRLPDLVRAGESRHARRRPQHQDDGAHRRPQRATGVLVRIQTPVFCRRFRRAAHDPDRSDASCWPIPSACSNVSRWAVDRRPCRTTSAISCGTACCDRAIDQFRPFADSFGEGPRRHFLHRRGGVERPGEPDVSRVGSDLSRNVDTVPFCRECPTCHRILHRQ